MSLGSPDWAANSNICAAPRSWTAAQSQTFQVTLTNAGSQTWPFGGTNPVELNVHFTSRPGGSGAMSSWFNTYNFLLPQDVLPGESVTVTVTIAVPTTTGSMYVEIQLFKNHQLWFPQWQSVPVIVG